MSDCIPSQGLKQMPRRNARADIHRPLDVTPEHQPQPTQPSRAIVRATRQAADIKQMELAERQRVARSNDAIDWSVCLVPGCGEELIRWGKPEHPPHKRDSEFELPMCYRHAATIWHRVLGSALAKDPELIGATADIREEMEERATAREVSAQAEWLQRKTGDIYFVRLNHLIKVGWSRNLDERIRSYGASVEVLMHYPGTRDDETALHRQLRPALARGREWYEDGPIIQRFIADALRRYGEPSPAGYAWTKPKQIVAGKRHGRR